jgi:hypothetical protein
MTNSATSTNPPAGLNGSAYLLPKPRRKPVRINRERRARIEAAVEGLLHLLDVIDGDADEENDDDEREPNFGPPGGEECEPDEEGEPSLGWTTHVKQDGSKWRGEPAAWSAHASFVTDGEKDDSDSEPSLGSLECHPGDYYDEGDLCSQELWGSSDTRDLEPNGDEGDYSDEGGRAI